ncbi:DUF4129 domain-containing protein [Thermococcus waiotapuensis]|uniref:DUF4129 domain-containing protein n=1 Tax=Thermococcus waiotapuensis TaxID=90909 RepID=A0AAE4NVV3_9EURY|nr:DUF4129 domain-containing protein [Thermococcus waiotapuensis]MDV3103788.1 DUF4129 domain-containing protein [Thermococcus waiotapuensis]
MSTRVRALTIMAIILTLMTLTFNHTARSSDSKTSESGPAVWPLLLSLAVIMSIVVIILLLLSWEDIKLKRKDLYRENVFSHLVRNALVIMLALLAIYFISKSSPAHSPINPINNTPEGTGNIGIPQPSNVSIGNSTIEGGWAHNTAWNNTVWIGYAAGIALIVMLAVFAIGYYREVMKRRAKKRIREKAKAFDRKLEDTGLGMFPDPREAVVGIYKNAVLWLEYLGLPYKESWTHWEHVEHTKYRKEAFLALTRLFEKAKYAPERVTWEDAEEALKAYKEIRGDLGEG